jgi:hypothetical protein
LPFLEQPLAPTIQANMKCNDITAAIIRIRQLHAWAGNPLKLRQHSQSCRLLHFPSSVTSLLVVLSLSTCSLLDPLAHVVARIFLPLRTCVQSDVFARAHLCHRAPVCRQPVQIGFVVLYSASSCCTLCSNSTFLRTD